MSTSAAITCPSCGESIPTDYVVCPYDGYSLVKELREKIRVNIKFREGIGRVHRILTNPFKNTNQVMEEVATNFDRKGPVVILFVFSFLFSFRIAAFSNAYINEGAANADIGFILILGIVAGLIYGFMVFLFSIIIWYLLTLMIHYGSRFLSGSASFKETQSVIGYAIAPFTIGLFLLNIALFFILPTGNLITTTSSISTLIGSVVGTGYTSDANIVNEIHLLFFLPFAAWAVYITGIGLEKIHRLSRVQAFLLPGLFMSVYVFIAFLS